MPAYSTVRRVLLQTGDPTERKVKFLALLTSALPKAGRRPVLAGGSAIEVYLDGVLRTGDMDVVYDARVLGRALRAWRFDSGSGLRAWVNDELGLAVDTVGDDLSGSYEKVMTITTDYGPAVIIGVEDLILKRLASAKHWKVPTDMEQAYLLAKGYEDRVDWSYVAEQASKDLTVDYLGRLKRMLSAGRTRARGLHRRIR